MTDTTTVDDTQVNTDSQEDFDAEFYGTGTPKAPVEDESTPTDNDDNSETEEENTDSEKQSNNDSENIDADDDDDDNTPAENDDDDSSATEQKPNKKKTAQERINELTAARREAEREAERLRAELAKRDTGDQENKPSEKTDETTSTETATAPNPDDKTKYPLGDLDPAYQQDMLDYKLDKRLQELDAQRQQEAQQQAEQARTQALQNEWTAKLEAAESSYEDFRETVETLDSTFDGINPEYGQFLAETLMSLDKGPDVLYHLAKHPEQAEAIVRSNNPVNAALALGRLEASLNPTTPTPKPPGAKATKAPRPPASVNKGNAPRFSVKPDTDDLDAFSDVFYTK